MLVIVIVRERPTHTMGINHVVHPGINVTTTSDREADVGMSRILQKNRPAIARK